MRFENTWQEIRDHSFIQNHSRSFRFTASSLQFTHSSSTGFRSENTWHEIRDHSFIQNHSRSSDSQLLLFSSLTHLLQGSGQRTPDTRSETIPSSRITPDLQIHSFISSVHLTHLLQGSDQRTPDKRSETIPSSRITPDPLDSQLLLFSSPHSSSTGFRSENTWHEIRDHSFIQNHSRSSDSQLLSSVHLTHLLQGSDQRTPDTRSETIPSSRITPDPLDSQLLLFSSPHSSSTGFRSENTWHEIRDHSFIQNHSRSSDSQLLLFSSPHSSSTGFRSENTWHEIRDHSFIQNLSRPFRFTASSLQFTHSSSTGFRSEDWNGHSWSHFCVVFEVCVWIIVRLEDPNMSIIRFLTESVTCWFIYLLVFDRIHDAMCLNKMSSSRNIGPHYQNTAVYLLYTWGTFYPCVHQTHLECLLLKS